MNSPEQNAEFQPTESHQKFLQRMFAYDTEGDLAKFYRNVLLELLFFVQAKISEDPEMVDFIIDAEQEKIDQKMSDLSIRSFDTLICLAEEVKQTKDFSSTELLYLLAANNFTLSDILTTIINKMMLNEQKESEERNG